MFTNIKEHLNYSLRYSANKKLFVPRTHHKSLSYTGVIIWNALPENIISSETFNKFKILYILKKTYFILQLKQIQKCNTRFLLLHGY